MRARAAVVMLALVCGAPAARPAAAADFAVPATLTLEAALAIGRQHQPDLRQARANTEAAEARVDQARAGLLPQISAGASYSRTTTNPHAAQSAIANTGGMVTPIYTGEVRSTFDNTGLFRSSVAASQLIYDFGRVSGQRDQARASADAQAKNEKTVALVSDLNVRTAFFTASAARGAVDAAKEALANQNRHLEQIQAFVDLGRSPPIDLLQAKVDQANADVDLIKAQNDYATARAILNQAMGVESSIAYEVQQTISAPMEGESLALEALVDQALAARPEIAALRDQQRAQELAIGATRARYYPQLGVQANGNYNGQDVDHLAWNLGATLNLSWLIYDGGNVSGVLREGAAALASLAAQVDSIRLQVRVEVEQAQLAVTAARALLGAADRSLSNARARLDLAEVRYRTGVGNGIELSDAQLASTKAAFQKLQAQLQLDTARAQLTKALART